MLLALHLRDYEKKLKFIFIEEVCMKRTVFFKTILILTQLFFMSTFFNSITFADEIIGSHSDDFVDENGDGYHDNAPDHDSDGIPNGRDPDFVRGKGKGKRWRNNFIDENGDGYNDNAPDHDNDGIPDNIDKDYKRRGFRYGRVHGAQEVVEELDSEEITDPDIRN